MIDNQLLDRIDEGIILLNASLEIMAMNEKAKRTMGILLSGGIQHGAGRIQRGDVVMFITNVMGGDDGNLTPELLTKLGIPEHATKVGQAVMGVGLFDMPSVKGVYKAISQSELSESAVFETDFLGHHMVLTLDFNGHRMAINYDGQSFEQHYLKEYGHLVIIDGQSGALKFYQDKGYTVRREAVGDLLREGDFRAKGNAEGDGLALIGQAFEAYFASETLFMHLAEMVRKYNEMRTSSPKSLYEPSLNAQNLYLELNQRPVYCILESYIDGHGQWRILIKIRDLSEMRELLTERDTILESIEALRLTARWVPNPEILKQFEALTGQSRQMVNVKFLAYRAAQIRSNVLITGESGTGKTLLARLIHEQSGAKGNFIEVNCAAIPPTLFESELFGYERGAFTGADQRGKKGFFELAENGTLFLDEIGELPPDIQVKLLQALQSKQFFKLGALSPTRVNTRIITATNKVLYAAVRENQFREDLYYRINVYPIALPPLRDRQEDLYLLVRQIMSSLSKTLGMRGKQLTSEAYAQLRRHDWPGNIRELENVLERAMAVCLDDLIGVEHIQLYQHTVAMQTMQKGQPLSLAFSNDETLKARVEAYERALIAEALQRYENHNVAMKALGLAKSSFYDRLKKYGLGSTNQ